MVGLIYTSFVEALEDIQNSISEHPKVVVIHFYMDWASLDNEVYGKLDQMYTDLEGRHGSGVIKLLKVSVDSQKEMISVFDLESYPTVFVLRRDLSIVAKFTLEEVMGGYEEVVKKFTELVNQCEAETKPKPPRPTPDTEKFKDVLNGYIADLLEEKGESSTDPRPNILECLRQLKRIISEIENSISGSSVVL